MNQDFDKEIIFKKIIKSIQKQIVELEKNSQNQLWEHYNDKLFKKGKIMPFQNKVNQKFMGIIQKVSNDGKLQLLIENDVIKEFEIKEIVMIY